MTCGRSRPSGVPAWVAALLLLASIPCGGRAAASHHLFWEVKGRHNTVYLLGSVHMLRAPDSALPVEILDAYSRSGALVMELDLNEARAEALLGSDLELAMLPEGQSLSGVLGPELYAEFLAKARSLDLDPALAERFQPWFAALLVEQQALARSGFEADAGVDMQMAQRAEADH